MKRTENPPFVLLAGWTMMVMVSAFLLFLHERETTRKEALGIARAYASQAQGYLRWASVVGGFYANSEIIRPNIFLPSRKHVVTTSEGERLVFVSPFQMIREENELRSKVPEPAASIRAVSLKPINPENTPDDWEKSCLLDSAEVKEWSEVNAEGEASVMRLLLPLALEHSCLDCHRYQNEKAGDIWGGISVSVPLKHYAVQENKRILKMFAFHILAWFLGVGFLMLYSHVLKQHQQSEMDDIAMLRSLMGSANTLECLLDANGRPLYVSPSSQNMLGIASERLQHNPGMLTSMVHPDDQQRYQELMVTKPEHTGELVRIVLQNGTIRYHYVVCCLADEGTRKVHCTHVDFSLLKQRQDDSVRRDQEKHLFSFAGGVAHDFNNVLASISTFIHLLKEEFSDREDLLRDYITPLRIAFRLGKNFTANLLAFSQRQLDVMKLISLNRTVSGIEEVVRAMLNDEINFLCNLASSELPVFADQNQVEQIIIDLAHNAKDAMPTGGELEIKTELLNIVEEFSGKPDKIPSGTYMCLSIRDTGGGIMAEHFEDIFQPFYSTKKSKHGIGIGLVVVQGIIRRHNAFLDIASKADQGTTANVYFTVSVNG